MKIEVLDKGYVELIEAWGQNEEGIIAAARQSTQGSFRGWDKDFKLLKYLYEHKHSTPFEFCGMTIEVQAPIFVFREWHRHRTQSYNEMSARYSPLPDLNYLPTFERLEPTETANKQAQSKVEFDHDKAVSWLGKLEELYHEIERIYQIGLSAGIPKEVARVCLPVGRYSRMRASANLRNWLAFLTLRCDENAQFEIREYANAVADIMRKEFPKTMELFDIEKDLPIDSRS